MEHGYNKKMMDKSQQNKTNNRNGDVTQVLEIYHTNKMTDKEK